MKPENVVLSHYDDFASEYKNGEDPNGDMDFVWLADYHGFVRELHRLQKEEKYKFTLHEPKTGQCIRFPRGAPVLPCEN